MQDPRRQYERHGTEAVTCDVGSLLDLSKSGMRVFVKGKLPFKSGQLANAKLSFAGGTLTIKCQPMWIKRRGLRAHEVGLKFVGLSGPAQKAIGSLAAFGFIGKGADMEEDEPRSSAPPPKKKPRKDVPDHYGALELAPGASEDEIRTAFRRLARKYHPDVSNSDDAQARFIVVQTAYHILIDPDQRREYDIARGKAA